MVGALSFGALGFVRRIASHDTEYSVSSQFRAFCQEFSGLTFGPVARPQDIVFQPAGKHQRIANYVCIGNQPFLAGIENGESHILLAGSQEILDIDAAVDRGVRPLDWFSRLVPALMFLRHAFGDRCWQAARKLACFIVDDPLLRNRHGFLEYDALLAAMERANFATNMAFIPWNFRRSHPRVAELFRRHPSRLSLSVHGCDHTKGEFGVTAAAPLLLKARTAKHRMANHREFTGVSCDNVMVFPQGIFSTPALGALKQAGYLAAVNTTPFPVDEAAEKLCVRDLLSPAVTRYSSLPLFVRHYPTEVAEFALDLFLGKPALIVEHHEYFRDGCQKLEEFVARVNGLCDRLEWCGLEEVVRRSCLRRTDEDGTVHVRFFADRCVVRNDSPTPRRYQFSKLLGRDQLQPPPVTIAGERVTAKRVKDELCFERVLQAGEQVVVELGDPAAPLSEALAYGSLWYRLSVFARRHLCELRDNYFSHKKLISAALSVARRVFRK